ncbi:hypothetical protein BDN70DRAFT_918640 [Pholiota conissans]|uniref:Uncharacterized protein n=1 Tax=Pholiota conissans TaxID=109636 RepID=A0A9P6D4I6_9AGAR|nr:hypothetical protein BDN70DRAFT_918640 [Pholiota conissans]
MSFSKNIDMLELPPELEYDILKLVVDTTPGQAFKLCMVSRYVQEWMEAIMYKTVLLNWPGAKAELFMRTFDTRPACFFAEKVKHLIIKGKAPDDVSFFSQTVKVIEACAGANDITCWLLPNSSNGVNLVHAISRPNLNRLSITFDALSNIDGSGERMKFTPEMFPHLTHLEIAYPNYNILDAHSGVDIDWPSIATLPSLSHLVVGELYGRDNATFAASMRHILDNCPNLKILILVADSLHLRAALVACGVCEFAKVMLFGLNQSLLPGYWEGIMRGQPGYWEIADCYLDPSLSKSMRDEKVRCLMRWISRLRMVFRWRACCRPL